MNDNRREQIIEIVKKEFIGPDPIDWEGLVQENGEEILSGDPPTKRYIAGILFPQSTLEEGEGIGEEDSDVEGILIEDDFESFESQPSSSDNKSTTYEYLEDAEELINRSNAYKQSAISLTGTIRDGASINIEISAGVYESVDYKDSSSGYIQKKYFRKAIFWNNKNEPLDLSSANMGIKKIDIPDTALRFNITYRFKRENQITYTFTLENTNTSCGKSFKDDDCYFQVYFKLTTPSGFCPLTEDVPINSGDEDYLSNTLLYRKVKSYAMGHGCAPDWEDNNPYATWIATTIFPEYEIKPIVPNHLDDVSLEMFKMSDLGCFETTIHELNVLCDSYSSWIDGLKSETINIEEKYKLTAQKHIDNCVDCLSRMRNGVALLEQDENVRTAFQLMNHAMLLQQLHYSLPLQKWIDDKNNNLILENPVQLPEILDSNTWYEKDTRIYGKWRPFQLAFILINLKSMNNKSSDERDIVDLIWFPTGGGKTEAYLGLSAYTIFLRRLKNKDDSGTAILMRYTLRLLTAQQYERASAMICACELIRKDRSDILGDSRISIGLWVGSTTSPNSMKDAVTAFDKLYNGTSDSNPFVMLKCPWCGAQMGMVQLGNSNNKIVGYKKILLARGKKHIIFRCNNTACDFSSDEHCLPLYVIDESIYENTPTLLLGTVDKFAMLPFRPQAQAIFGYKDGKKISSPDLIIQDELHLISGPLGSMVGLYETLIYELCTSRSGGVEVHPKTIASTATISRASEQCQALYGCEKEKVFQFPPQGLETGDSFFAREDTTQKGRKYVGILAPGATSEATAAIRLYASLLYAAKKIIVIEENQRDPYWTNMGYYNSIRELGQAATWIKADIDQYLDIMYKRRYDDKRYSDHEEYKKKRRYIRRDEELTSRIRSDKVTASLANLNISYLGETDEKGKGKEYPIDICLATNMISVGLDVPRLGLMTVAGQPKTTSEYIQATSRVGRDLEKSPGVIFTLYKPGRPRDKSHYEQFKSYHSKIYSHVEPTSVTPFSAPIRERALHAILIGILRLEGSDKFNEDPPTPPDQGIYEKVRHIIMNRLGKIDKVELAATLERLDYIIHCWEDWEPSKFHDFQSNDELPLMFPAASRRNTNWGEVRGFKTPTSMRNVDAACEVSLLENRY